MSSTATEQLPPSVHEIMEFTGATYRQLHYWVRNGWLLPNREPSKKGSLGSGVPRVWPDDELRIAAYMSRLVNAGLEPAIAAQAARDIVASRYPTVRIAPNVTITVWGGV